MTTAAATTSEQTAKSYLAAAVGSAQVGVTPAPAPELNGLLLQLPGAPAIYLVLNAFRRWVPSPVTMANLFKGNPTVVPDIGIGAVSEGAALSVDAILAQAQGRAEVYLVSNGVKMWIPNPDIFNRYQFNSAKIQVVAPILIDSIPSGPNVEGPHQ